MTGRPRTTRRGFLAVADAATLAGCNRVGDRLEDDGPKIDGDDLRDAIADDPPAVPETLPVDIERSRLDGVEAHARDRLSSVPSPFDERQVPNGAIRAELTRMRKRATESLADGDVEGMAVGSALGDLYRSVSYADGLDDERASGLRASVVCSAHETLVRVRAFETLRKRVANGDHAVVESAADVRALRERAVAAVEDAVESTAGAPLAERVLSEVAAGIGAGDHRLERYADRDEIPVDRFDYAFGRYVTVEAMAGVIPAVSATVADAVRRQL